MRQEGRGSIYRAERSPPRREYISHELDEHTNRIKELLRTDLNLLEEENAILKAKCKKVTQLEEKVESIMKQNSQLLSENDRLSKLLHQKKSQVEMIRDKYQSQLSQKMGYAAEHQFQKKKMLNQIERLQNELAQVQHLRNMQLNQAKAQFQIDFQSVKRQAVSAQQVYQGQIRKLREQVDKREYEIAQQMNRFKRLSSDSEYEIVRLKEQKQKLKNELMYVEQDRKKQLDGLRLRLQANYTEQVQHSKKNLSNTIVDLEMKNQKLRDMLQSRNQDIQQLTSKTSKQKLHSQQVITLLKKQNQSMRSKLVQIQRLGQTEKDSLKIKLGQLHQAQIQQIRVNNQKYIDCLQAQIRKMEVLLAAKGLQIEQLIKQKSSIKLMFDGESTRLKDQLQGITIKLKSNQSKLAQIAKGYQQKLMDRNNHIAYLDKLNEDQLKNNQEQLNALKGLIEGQKAQINSQRISMQQKQQYLKQTISQLKQNNQEIQQTLRKQKSSRSQDIQQIQNQYETIISDLRSKLSQSTSRLSILQKQLKALKQNLAIKQRQNKNLQARIHSVEQRQHKLEKQNDQLRLKLGKKDQKCNEMLIQQKNRLQQNFSFTLQNLRADHEQSLKLQSRKYADLMEKLERKDEQLVKILKSYQKLRAGMQALTEQEANRKEMTLKIPGATADIIATKNLFDVYLKTRVIDICSDAQQQKENYQKK